jgi:3-isopropylmalate dehydrogenase
MIDKAIAAALGKDLRTGDIASPGTKVIGTAEIGSTILAEMETLAA